MANIDGFPDNPVAGSDYIDKMLEQLKMIYNSYNMGIPYSFDGTLTLEAKFNVLFKTVYDFLNNNRELIETWGELYTWIKNYFQNLDVQEEINNKLDQIVASGQFDDILNSYFDSVDKRITAVESKNTSQDREIGTLETKVSQLLEDMENLKYKRLIVVSKEDNEGQFHTINAAIDSISDNSNSNQYVILILPGDYNETISLENTHGLNFIGLSKESTKIHASGVYPTCVIQVTGDCVFKNLTIKNDNNNTYAVHSDVGINSYTGTLLFENCRIEGGSSAIGYGGGQDCTLYLKNCELSASGSVLYMHNNPYSNKSNQNIIVDSCFFKLTNNNVMTFDDACASNNNKNSICNLIFNNNYTNINGFAKVSFRKNTTTSTEYSYFPTNDANIKLSYNSNGNNKIPALNYNEGQYSATSFLLVPPQKNASGYYDVAFPIFIDAVNYKATLTNVTVPGVGDVTQYFTIGTPYKGAVTITTQSDAYAGKVVSVSITLTCP